MILDFEVFTSGVEITVFVGGENSAVLFSDIVFVYVAHAIFYFFNIRRGVVYLIRDFFTSRPFGCALFRRS